MMYLSVKPPPPPKPSTTHATSVICESAWCAVLASTLKTPAAPASAHVVREAPTKMARSFWNPFASSMPRIASALITLLVLVQKTPLSTTMSLLNDWRCKSPPTSSASSSPLRCFIIACICF